MRLVQQEEGSVFLARDIDDAPPTGPDEVDGDAHEARPEGAFGFLTPHPPDDPDFTFADRDDDYPETWLEFDAGGGPRLKKYYRGARARHFEVTPDGHVGPGTRVWFLPGKFRLCLRCGNTLGGAARDRTRLASLSAEGRSSATTVLVGSALRWMHGAESALDPYTRKLLGFTDNRQDAALQAGHFNDFLFVSLVRAGFLGALRGAGSNGLRSDELGVAQQRTLGFDRSDPQIRAEWLLEPTLRGFNLQEAEGTLRQVLAYRIWFDQRRGWRYTNPNLEQLGMVQVQYLGLEDLAADDELFADSHRPLKQASRAVRTAVYRELLDHMRKWMAIRSQVLDTAVLEQLVAKSHSRLRPPWGLGIDEKPRAARWLMIVAPTRRAATLRDMELIVRGGSRSGLGRTLRSTSLWGGDTSIRDLKAKAFDQLVEDLLRAGATHGLVSEESTPFDQPGWRLNDACVLFQLGGTPEDGSGSRQNAFFRDLYENLARMLRAPMHPLFGFEAREHTAQVDPDNREIREKRFRFGDREREELATDEKRLREAGEAQSVPAGALLLPDDGARRRHRGTERGPHAQRAAHAGELRPARRTRRAQRSGRPGHHVRVFAEPPRPVLLPRPQGDGPRRGTCAILELANRDLIDSHLQAVWLSCVDQPLDPCIAELLVLDDASRPIEPDITAALKDKRVASGAGERIRRVLDLVADDLASELAPWYTGRRPIRMPLCRQRRSTSTRHSIAGETSLPPPRSSGDAARRTMDDYSASYQDKRAAQTHHAQAMDQLNLLQRGTNALSSDFYTYRYLATEAFCPGTTSRGCLSSHTSRRVETVVGGRRTFSVRAS